MSGRPSIPVWVNGIKHRSVSDAIVTTKGTEVGMRKALSLGLKFMGFEVSREPPEETPEKPKHYPGLSLIRHPQVTP
jgi:hypothetical protein